jgi:hypothetical protein
MPYEVTADAIRCEGWAVLKSDTREVVRCHATQAEAKRQQRALNARERIGGDAARPFVAIAPMTFTLADPSQRAIVATLDRQSRAAAERRAAERINRQPAAKLALSARRRLLARSQDGAETRHVSEARQRRAAAARARIVARPHPTVAEPTAWLVPDERTRRPR